MFAGSSTPLQDDQGNSALVQALEKVAAGRSEETGINTPEVVARISLRMFKILREKHENEVKMLRVKQEDEVKVLRENQEIERSLDTMKISHMQTKLEEMAENLRSCEDEAQDQRKRELETLRSQVTVWEWVERTQIPKQDNLSPYEHVDTKRLQISFENYVKAVKTYGKYMYKLWKERKGRTFLWTEYLEHLLKNFRVPEDAHAAFKPANQHLIWELWVSSVMFNGFEGPFVDESYVRAKKYVEVFPRWLFLELGGSSQDDRSKMFEDIKFSALFIDIVRHVQSMHRLVLAPARVPATLMIDHPGSVFHETHHSCAGTHPDPQSGGERFVQVMLTPGFRVGSEVITKCRVLCSEH